MPALSAAHVARALRPRPILLRLFKVIEATNETHTASTATLVKPGRRTIVGINHPRNTMQIIPSRLRAARHAIAALAITLAAGTASAADTTRGIEQALTAAQQDKRGITLYVSGQAIGGAVTRIEPGQWVEMKNQTASKIIVRLDRIDGIAAH
jgi:hypothetical protein